MSCPTGSAQTACDWFGSAAPNIRPPIRPEELAWTDSIFHSFLLPGRFLTFGLLQYNGDDEGRYACYLREYFDGVSTGNSLVVLLEDLQALAGGQAETWRVGLKREGGEVILTTPRGGDKLRVDAGEFEWLAAMLRDHPPIRFGMGEFPLSASRQITFKAEIGLLESLGKDAPIELSVVQQHRQVGAATLDVRQLKALLRGEQPADLSGVRWSDDGQWLAIQEEGRADLIVSREELERIDARVDEQKAVGRMRIRLLNELSSRSADCGSPSDKELARELARKWAQEEFPDNPYILGKYLESTASHMLWITLGELRKRREDDGEPAA